MCKAFSAKSVVDSSGRWRAGNAFSYSTLRLKAFEACTRAGSREQESWIDALKASPVHGPTHPSNKLASFIQRKHNPQCGDFIGACSKPTVHRPATARLCATGIFHSYQICATGIFHAYQICATGIFHAYQICATGIFHAYQICATGIFHAYQICATGVWHTRWLPAHAAGHSRSFWRAFNSTANVRIAPCVEAPKQRRHIRSAARQAATPA